MRKKRKKRKKIEWVNVSVRNDGSKLITAVFYAWGVPVKTIGGTRYVPAWVAAIGAQPKKLQRARKSKKWRDIYCAEAALLKGKI